jgi:tetratricopeptide (TPR) repeat protein
VTAIILATAALGIPALAFTLWPVFRGTSRGGSLLPLPPDRREQLLEEKRRAYHSLRELEFEHGAGHLSDEDYASLRDRYEATAADVLAELDALAPEKPRRQTSAPATETSTPWTRRPATVAVGAVVMLTFGIVLGLGAARYTEPDRTAGGMPGAGPMAGMPGAGAMGGMPGVDAPSAANAPKGPVTPQMLEGMLNAARQSLYAGRYNEAISAYQAVLKRDPKNVDALTHLGVIVALGGHGDQALETIDRALAIDPNYPIALVYRGQVQYELKADYAGAVKSWERFLTLVPTGEDHDRIAKLVEEARAKSKGAAPAPAPK